MAGATERAINMALRVVGLAAVERDFKRAGDAGEKSFAQVKKSANGAAQEVSEYTARLRRVTAAAKDAFANMPDLNKGGAEQVAANRRDFLLTAINTEKENMLLGKPESTQNFTDFANGVDRSNVSLAGMALRGAAAAAALKLLYEGVVASIEAYKEHEAAIDKFRAQVALAGNVSLTTGRDIEQMAEQIRDATLQSEEAALQGAASLAKIPGLTRASFEEILTVSAQLADALQTDVADVIETYVGPALLALAENDIKALVEATEGLDPQLRLLVVNLAEAGRTADAQRALIDGLREKVGDGPDGLTTATDRLNDRWERMKTSFGEDIASIAVPFLDSIGTAMDRLAERTNIVQNAWMAFRNAIPGGIFLPVPPTVALGSGGRERKPGMLDLAMERVEQAKDAARRMAAQAELDRRYGKENKTPRGGGGRRSGGGSGRSEADREAERLKREAESARESADRIAESNDEVIVSFERRVREVDELIGLEGEALRAVERRHEIEATVRRINREEIEKEVEARRAAAAAAGKEFDEAAAVRDATAAVDAKAEALRKLAERYVTANEEIDDFNAYQRQAAQILEAIKSPMERFTEDLQDLEKLRIGNFIDDDQFDRAMDHMAERLAELRYELDENAHAWAGFGADVGQTLVDFVMDGGNALDILRELIRIPLQRLLDQQVGNPVADWIDGLTGNNRDKNVAAARAELQSDPGAAQVLVLPAQAAANSLTQVQTTALGAAQALALVSGGTVNPVIDLANQSDQAAQAMGQLVPVTGQLGGAFSQVLSLLAAQAGGGGGGGGFLSSALGIAGLLFGGGAGPNPALAGDAAATIAANPGLFASGTDRIPTGRPFWVGENGRELMEKDRGGNLRVYSNQQAHRMAGGGGGNLPPIVMNVNVPERSDPRRTQSTISRGMQRGIEMAHRKGLAVGGRRS